MMEGCRFVSALPLLGGPQGTCCPPVGWEGLSTREGREALSVCGKVETTIPGFPSEIFFVGF